MTINEYRIRQYNKKKQCKNEFALLLRKKSKGKLWEDTEHCV